MALSDLVLSYLERLRGMSNLLWVTHLGANITEMVSKIPTPITQMLYLNSTKLWYLLVCLAGRWARDILKVFTLRQVSSPGLCPAHLPLWPGASDRLPNLSEPQFPCLQSVSPCHLRIVRGHI